MSSKIPKEDLEVLLADRRYESIGAIIQSTVLKGERGWTLTDVLDRAFLDRYLGIPLFLTLLWAMFQFTYEVSAPFMELIDMFFGWLGELAALIPNEYVASFIGDGLIGGIGFIMVFIVPIAFLFLWISVLEDSGYLARAAFVMDRLMSSLGLHGRSFMPMLLGFGCNIPAVMATRSIEGEKDRLITILVNPFMSCGARLPVYILFAGALFGVYAGSVVWSLYVLGVVVAVLSALLFRKTIAKGEPSPFLLELPIFRRPKVGTSLRTTWERTSIWVKKVFTILLAGAIVLWILASFPWGAELEASYAGMIGHAIQPILAPLGFDWRAAVGLLFGFMAKEIVVETFSILYAVESEAGLMAIIGQSMTPLVAYAFMAFTLLYMPCLALFGTIKRETGSWKWTIFITIYGIVVAYLVAAIIIGTGTLLGFG